MPSSSFRSWLRAFAVCQAWSFILFAPGLGMITLAANRYFWSWSYDVLAGRFLIVSGLGLGLFLVGLLLWKLSPTLYEGASALAGVASLGLMLWWAYQFIAGKSLLVLLCQAIMFPLLAAGLTQISRRRGWTLARWKKGLSNIALFVSPVVPIFWLNALTYPTYPPNPVPSLEAARQVPNRPGEAATDNVYVFVFDEWPYNMTCDAEGQVLPLMPKLAVAAQTMCVFTDAHSPGCQTYSSMPRLLFQRPEEVIIRGDQVGFWDGQTFHPSREQTNLFAEAREQGYRTYMVGWYVLYNCLLGSSVDFVRSTLYYDQLGDGHWQRARAFVWDGAIRLLGEAVATQLIGGHDVLHNYSIVWQNQTLLDCTDAILSDPRPGQFAVFHLPLPHFPFCYGPHGAKPLSVRYDYTSADQLREQLTYLDQVIAGLLEKIRQAGKEGNSTVILTSDHAWRCDPALEPYVRGEPGIGRPLTHVPLLIRFPGQTSPVRVDAPFATLYLRNLLEMARKEGFRPEGLPEMLREAKLYQTIADGEAYQGRPEEK